MKDDDPYGTRCTLKWIAGGALITAILYLALAAAITFQEATYVASALVGTPLWAGPDHR